MKPQLMKALGDPTRLSIFERLCSRELTVNELKGHYSVSQPAISQHLKVLKRCGLVSERRTGKFAHYRGRPEGLRPLAQWLDYYKQFWPARMKELDNVLKEIPDERK